MRRANEQSHEYPHETPTVKQDAFMARHHLHRDRDTDFYEASHTIRQYVDSRRALPPTDKQEKFLRQRGKWRDGLNRGQAFDVINAIVNAK